mmetsp:Transcript_19662/g.78257  ORF Transcript_19662/g.78257 Transcript_19662/m.78257 type:complete len:240 (+) Transcript_19662:52-771(+)
MAPSQPVSAANDVGFIMGYRERRSRCRLRAPSRDDVRRASDDSSDVARSSGVSRRESQARAVRWRTRRAGRCVVVCVLFRAMHLRRSDLCSRRSPAEGREAARRHYAAGAGSGGSRARGSAGIHAGRGRRRRGCPVGLLFSEEESLKRPSAPRRRKRPLVFFAKAAAAASPASSALVMSPAVVCGASPCFRSTVNLTRPRNWAARTTWYATKTPQTCASGAAVAASATKAAVTATASSA